jgi:hypothetical protein
MQPEAEKYDITCLIGVQALAGSQPVVVGLDSQHPNADASLLHVDNGRDHGILLCRRFGSTRRTGCLANHLPQ